MKIIVHIIAIQKYDLIFRNSEIPIPITHDIIRNNNVRK